MVLACDLVLASEKARFGQPETNLGLFPGFGGCARLLRRVGVGRARELIYSGRLIDAAEALELGLVQKTCAPGELQSQAEAMDSSPQVLTWCRELTPSSARAGSTGAVLSSGGPPGVLRRPATA